jgi:hypothetical protein
MAEGSRKKSGAQHLGSLGGFECGIHGTLLFDLHAEVVSVRAALTAL